MIRHSLNNNTLVACYISLFKFKSFDQFNTPQTASNFRHLLSCGTIATVVISVTANDSLTISF